MTILNKRLRAASLGTAIALSLFSFAPVANSQNPSVSWTAPTHNASWPGSNSYTTLQYDPFSQQTLYYGILPTASGIYSTDIYFYKASTNTWTHLGGTGSPTDNCNDGSASATQSWPSDRHPSGQMAIDTKRHVLWLYGGVCNTVAQTNGIWKLSLNADPTQDRWTKTLTLTSPYMFGLFQFVYDPDDDVVFAYGFNGSTPQNWLFCPTDMNATPGSLTGKQTAAGCVQPDDWNQLTPKGVVSTVECGVNQPCGWQNPAMVYDTVTRKAILYGGTYGATTYKNETWAYDVPTRTWTMKALTGPHPAANPQDPSFTPFAYNPSDHKVYLHVTAPTPSDWVYDPSIDQWAPMSSTGTGGTIANQTMAYDASTNSLLAWYQGFVTPDIWVGKLGPASSDTTTPSTPAGLSATAISSSEIDISWTASTDNVGVSGYKVFRNGTQIATVTATTYANTGLSANTTYTYSVSAFDAAGNISTQSLSVSAATPAPTVDVTPPTVPAALTASAVSSSAITLAWSASTDAVGTTGYNILRNGIKIASSASPTYSDTGLTPSTTYSYTVSAYDAAGNNSAQSSAASATTLNDVTSKSGSIITSLTIQETVYPGSVQGVARTQDPVSAGIPLSQNANITAISQLGLSGTGVGQFRVLGCWSGIPTPAKQATSCGGGAIKWVNIDSEADIGAGQTNTGIALTTGAGNFGGANLATDNGPTITIDTGAAQFTIKKANFNGLDKVVVGGSTIVSTGVSQGLVLTGPDPSASYPGNVTCLPNAGGSVCATAYSSANDASSTCIIEENGPVKAVIRCDGSHVDTQGHVYLQFTARESFYKGKTTTKVQSVLRNADYGLSNTFASAFKGLKSYEFRVGASLSGTLNYSIANHTGTPTTGTMSGSDAVSIYQGQSQLMQWDDCHTAASGGGAACANLLTTDTGYVIAKNGSNVQTGSETQYPQGWADISNGSGAGIQIGMEQFSAHYPASLEFNGGGSDVRVGIFARENSQAVYQSWPQWSIANFWLNFHSSVPSSLANDFLKYQHFLVARAPYTHYNAAAVFPYELNDPAAEDAYYTSLGATSDPAIDTSKACCIKDLGTAFTAQFPLSNYKAYAWGATGAGNQAELRWSNLTNFLKRGMTGRFLDARSFYLMSSQQSFAMTDGFTWRSHENDSPAILDGYGRPTITSANNTLAYCGQCGAALAWLDWAHGHAYGVGDYYFLTGDEVVKDALVNGGWKDLMLTNKTQQAGYLSNYAGSVNTSGATVSWAGTGSQFLSWWAGMPILINGEVYTIQSVTSSSSLVLTSSAGTQNNAYYGIEGGLPNLRANAVALLWYSRYSQFLTTVGDSDATAVLKNGKNLYQVAVKPPLCASGYPAGCDSGPALAGPWKTQGISYERGLPYTSTNGGYLNYHDSACSGSGVPFGAYRGADTFLVATLAQSVYELRTTAGSGWSDYWTALDQAYGMSQWMLSEAYHWDGTAQWYPNNGFGFEVYTDVPNACDANYQVSPTGVGTVWAPFFIQSKVIGGTSWRTKFEIALRRVMSSANVFNPEYGDYQMAYDVNAVLNPSASLSPVTITSVTDLGGGNYKVTWTVPDNATSYRVKWGPKRIVEWIGFDPGKNVWMGDPSNTMNWFAANDSTPFAPVPGPAGSSQSMTVSTSTSGLSMPNFSVKAYVGGGIAAAPPSQGQATSLTLVSGNGQSGVAGATLTGVLTVRAADVNGNAVMGVTVNFSVNAGGGTLSTNTVSTDTNGLASSRLTLGPTAGTNTVTAAAGTLVGSPITFTETATTAAAGPAVNLILVSGNGQTGAVGQPLGSPYIVKVTDAGGNPVSGTTVNFSVTNGTGTLSASAVATGSDGTASSTLTLGMTAGTTLVTASSASLTGSPVTFTATANDTKPAGGSGSTVTWTQSSLTSGWPGGNAWLVVRNDPVSSQTILYGVPAGSVSGYSSDLFFYNSARNAWTHVGGTGAMTAQCTPDTPSQPGERQIMGQMAVDTTRNLLWLYGGTCRGDVRQDMYYLKLNADPASNVWHQLTPAHIPTAAIASSMIYDPDDDVLFAYGYDGGAAMRSQWIYCRTAENPLPGTPTAKQMAAGCTVGDDWNEINHAQAHPVATQFVGLIYDPINKKALLYGGTDGGATHHNETWTYDIPTHTWLQKCQGSCIAPPVDADVVPFPAIVFHPGTRKVILHQSSGLGAPADWQYDPAVDTWTKLGSAGTPLSANVTIALDPTQNKVIAWTQGSTAQLWQGTLATATPSCDANGDGIVNLVDVQMVIGQAQGTSACGNADLDGDGACTVIDIQRIINAALGGACRVGG